MARFDSSVALTLALTLLGCAAEKPVVYGSAAQGSQVARVVGECQVRANAAGARGDALPRLVRGAAQRSKASVPLGAAAGAVAGGSRGAAAGAAIGVAVALAGSGIDSLEQDSLYVRYMQLCVQEAGFVVVGWR
jgi:hypothetical protein